MSLYKKSLVVTAAFLPTYLIRFSLFGIPTTFLETLIWLTFLLGLLQPSIRQSWVNAWKLFSLPRVALAKWGVFFFLFSAVVSTAVSPHLETSLGILKGWIITPMLYGFMVYASIRHSDLDIRHYAKALILSGVVMALLGISQVGTLDRVRGIFDVPNSLALFLTPIAILTAFSARQSPHRFLFSLFFFLIALAIIFTQSFAGVLSLAIVITIGLFLFKIPYRFLFSLFFFLLLPLIFMPKIQYLLQPNSSAAVRLQLWSISWDLIKEHPLFGVGLGTFEPAYQEKLHERFARYNSGYIQEAPLPEYIFRDPHNWLLSFWLNLGLLGLLSFTSMHVLIFFRIYKNWDLLGVWNLGFGISAALLVLLVFGLVDTIYFKNDLAALHWLLIALASSSLTAQRLKGIRISEAN